MPSTYHCGMLRLLTAGESHGKALVGILEGLPAGVPVSDKALAEELARRRHGYGRSGRQSLERDAFEVLGGLRHGRTLGAPIALTIANAEWEQKYRDRMAPFVDPDPSERLTRPRPGHADLAGMQKYGADDARDILERASARETATRVGLGYFCKAFLAELGIQVLSHVVRIGSASVGDRALPTPGELDAIDGSPVRCADPAAAERMVSAIDEARRTVDVDTGQAAEAITQRTDVCAVPAGAVVGEAMVAYVLADALLEKFGGDSLGETRRNLESFVDGLR